MIFDSIMNAVQNANNIRNAERNYQFQREVYDYTKSQNQLRMDREDNAVQRRAKDLEAAGLSKTLAAGSAAQASAPIVAAAPQKANQNRAQVIGDSIQQAATIASTVQQARLMEDQIKAQRQRNNLDAESAEWYRSNHLPPNGISVDGMLGTFIKGKGTAQEIWSKYMTPKPVEQGSQAAAAGHHKSYKERTPQEHHYDAMSRK